MAFAAAQGLVVPPALLPDGEGLGEVSGLSIDEAQVELQRRLPGRVGMCGQKLDQRLNCVPGTTDADRIAVGEHRASQVLVLLYRRRRYGRERLRKEPRVQKLPIDWR